LRTNTWQGKPVLVRFVWTKADTSFTALWNSRIRRMRAKTWEVELDYGSDAGERKWTAVQGWAGLLFQGVCGFAHIVRSSLQEIPKNDDFGKEMPVLIAGSTSGAKSGEWLEGKKLCRRAFWAAASFAGSAPPRLKIEAWNGLVFTKSRRSLRTRFSIRRRQPCLFLARIPGEARRRWASVGVVYRRNSVYFQVLQSEVRGVLRRLRIRLWWMRADCCQGPECGFLLCRCGP